MSRRNFRKAGVTLQDIMLPGEPAPSRKFPTFTEELWHTVASRFDHIMNSNRIWETFCKETIDPNATICKRYIRINPDLSFLVPRLDDLDKVDKMEKCVQDIMASDRRVAEVAHRLVASTFFFEKIDIMAREGFECSGETLKSLPSL